MPVFVGSNDRLVTREGRSSWLKRGSVPLSFFNGGGSVQLSGQQHMSFQSVYETQPYVYVAVNIFRDQISRLPLKTYRMVEGTRGDGERERVRDHPLTTMLRRPAPLRGPVHLKQNLTFGALLHGNALLRKVDGEPGAPPAGVLPLDWRFVTPHYRNDAGEIAFWETNQNGDAQFLAPDEVIHIARVGGCGDLGVSPLKPLARTVAIEDAAQRYQAASFENGVRQSSVYVLPPDVDLNREERQELREEIKAQHGGVDKAFQMALVTGGGDIRPLSHTAVEAELIDQRKLDREEVAAVYAIPPPLVGILDHATYSNVAEMHRMLYGMVLGPWLVLIEETLQAQLIDSYAPWAEEQLFVEFDLAEVLKGDTLKEVLALKEEIQTGLATLNEGRAVRNRRAYDDPRANEPLIPTNNLSTLTDMGADDDDVVKSHLGRAVNRISRKMGAGVDPWDRDRFIRELAQDLGDEPVAAAYADSLEGLITEAAGDASTFRSLASSLT